MKFMLFITTFILCCVFSTNSFGFNLKVQILDINGQPASDIVVYLEPLEGQKTTKTAHQVVISQSQKSFSPYISVSQTGNPLKFSNSDDITHHIYSTNRLNAFSFTIKPGQELMQTAVSQATEIAMGCNVHDWMSGHLLVLDTPYFTRSNLNGQASLLTNDGGKYQLTLWHPQLLNKINRQSQSITISADQQVIIKLRSKLAKIPEQKSSADFDFLSDY